MLKIGLTGGIGSGKTLVGSIFRQLSTPVYEADKEARRLMESNIKIIRAVTDLFGDEAYLEGILNRKYIGGVVFKDQIMLTKLNNIVHPVVHEDFCNWSLKFKSKPYVIEEAAILFESGAAKKMDYTIFVKANVQARVQRVMLRDEVSEEDVRARIENQLDDKEKQELADFTICNENDSMILPQIVDLHNKFIDLNT